MAECDGMEKELAAQPATTAGPEKGNAILPATWEAALKPFEDSAFIREYPGAKLQQALNQPFERRTIKLFEAVDHPHHWHIQL